MEGELIRNGRGRYEADPIVPNISIGRFRVILLETNNLPIRVAMRAGQSRSHDTYQIGFPWYHASNSYSSPSKAG